MTHPKHSWNKLSSSLASNEGRPTDQSCAAANPNRATPTQIPLRGTREPFAWVRGSVTYGVLRRESTVRRDFRPSGLRFGVPAGKMNDLLKPVLSHIVCDCDSSIHHTSHWQRFHPPYTYTIPHDRASARSSPFDPKALPAISGAPYRIDTSHLLSSQLWLIDKSRARTKCMKHKHQY